MNKATLIPLLLILSLIALGYAIYRSTAARISTVDAANQQTIYNDTQHGLLLGLCLFAGMCLLGIVYMIDRDHAVIKREERSDLSNRRTLS